MCKRAWFFEEALKVMWATEHAELNRTPGTVLPSTCAVWALFSKRIVELTILFQRHTICVLSQLPYLCICHGWVRPCEPRLGLKAGEISSRESHPHLKGFFTRYV